MKKIWILGFILALLSPTVWSVKINSLYTGDIPVNSQSAAEKHTAMQRALAQVLIKVSGNNQTPYHSKIKSYLISPEKWVQEFGYITPQASEATSAYILHVRFDETGVNQILREASLPIWGQNRPLLFGWINITKPALPQQIITKDSTDLLLPLMQKQASRRGVPFTLPDQNMANTVNKNDFATMTATSFINASKRFPSAAILMGNITENNNELSSQWKLILGNDQWNWTFSGKSLTDILPPLMDQVANSLSSRYAIVISNNVQKNVTLKVIGISEQLEFAKLVRYLHQLTPVANVGILRITGNEVSLNVSLRSTEQSFIQAISQGQQLTPVNNEASSLIYQWNH